MEELKMTEAMGPCLTIVKEWMLIEKDEKVLLLADTTSDFLAVGLMAAAVRSVGADPVINVMMPRKRRGMAPPDIVQGAAMFADVVMNLAGSTSISYTRDRWKGRAPGSAQPFRSITMPHLDIDMLTCGLVEVDYKEIIAISDRLCAAMPGNRVRVTSAYGTDLSADVSGMKPERSGGIPVRKPGGNIVFPFGEVRFGMRPEPRNTEGILVIDTSVHVIGLVQQPIRCEIRKGKIVGIQGGREADKLREMVRADDDSDNVVEIAIGANPACRVTGNAQEDKKGLGRVHIGIGCKSAAGAKIDEFLHIDGIILKPTVEIDGKNIVKNGIVVV